MSCLHGLARDDEQYFGGPEGHCGCGLAYEQYRALCRVIGKGLLSRCVGVGKKELGAYFGGKSGLIEVDTLYERLGFLNFIVGCLVWDIRPSRHLPVVSPASPNARLFSGGIFPRRLEPKGKESSKDS